MISILKRGKIQLLLNLPKNNQYKHDRNKESNPVLTLLPNPRMRLKKNRLSVIKEKFQEESLTPVEIRVNLGLYTYGWWIEGHRTGDHFHQGSRKGTVSSSLTQAGWGFLQSFARSSSYWLLFFYFVMRKQGNKNLVVSLDFNGEVISPSQTVFWTPSTSNNQESHSSCGTTKICWVSLTSRPFPFQLILLMEI